MPGRGRGRARRGKAAAEVDNNAADNADATITEADATMTEADVTTTEAESTDNVEEDQEDVNEGTDTKEEGDQPDTDTKEEGDQPDTEATKENEEEAVEKQEEEKSMEADQAADADAAEDAEKVEEEAADEVNGTEETMETDNEKASVEETENMEVNGEENTNGVEEVEEVLVEEANDEGEKTIEEAEEETKVDITDPEEIKKLLACSICSNLCARGISVPCCGAQGCRACATKKVLMHNKCWNCSKEQKTEVFINDENLRSAVSLQKEGKEIPQETLHKIKERLESKKKKRERKGKKDFKTNFEEGDLKVYVALEGVKTVTTYITQIGCYIKKTGKYLHLPLKPPKSLQSLHPVLHFENVGDTVKYQNPDGTLVDTETIEEAFKRFIGFLQDAASEGQPICLVFSSFWEHYQFAMMANRAKNSAKKTYLSAINAIISTSVAIERKQLKKRLRNKKSSEFQTSVFDLLGQSQHNDSHMAASDMAELVSRLPARKSIQNGNVDFKPFQPTAYNKDQPTPDNLDKEFYQHMSPIRSKSGFIYNIQEEAEHYKLLNPTWIPSGKFAPEDKVAVNLTTVGLCAMRQPVMCVLKNLSKAAKRISYSTVVEQYRCEGTSKVIRVRDMLAAAMIVFFPVDVEFGKEAPSAAPKTLTKENVQLMTAGTLLISYTELTDDPDEEKVEDAADLEEVADKPVDVDIDEASDQPAEVDMEEVADKPTDDDQTEEASDKPTDDDQTEGASDKTADVVASKDESAAATNTTAKIRVDLLCPENTPVKGPTIMLGKVQASSRDRLDPGQIYNLALDYRSVRLITRQVVVINEDLIQVLIDPKTFKALQMNPVENFGHLNTNLRIMEKRTVDKAWARMFNIKPKRNKPAQKQSDPKAQDKQAKSKAQDDKQGKNKLAVDLRTKLSQKKMQNSQQKTKQKPGQQKAKMSQQNAKQPQQQKSNSFKGNQPKNGPNKQTQGKAVNQRRGEARRDQARPYQRQDRNNSRRDNFRRPNSSGGNFGKGTTPWQSQAPNQYNRNSGNSAWGGSSVAATQGSMPYFYSNPQPAAAANRGSMLDDLRMADNERYMRNLQHQRFDDHQFSRSSSLLDYPNLPSFKGYGSQDKRSVVNDKLDWNIREYEERLEILKSLKAKAQLGGSGYGSRGMDSFAKSYSDVEPKRYGVVEDMRDMSRNEGYGRSMREYGDAGSSSLETERMARLMTERKFRKSDFLANNYGGFN